MSWNDRFLFGELCQVRNCRPQLDQNAVHLWLVDLDNQEVCASALAADISAEESAVARRFKFPILERRYVLAHGVLRRVLSSYLGIPPLDIAFRRTVTGKPHLDRKHDSQLFFNLSHCENTAAIAVTAAGEVGVDLERQRFVPDHLDIARHHFAKAEYEQIAAASPGRADALFFLCWTRKEAFVKATGEGLTRPLRSFTVTLAEKEAALELSGGGSASWSLTSFRPRPDLVGAVAVKHSTPVWVMLPPPHTGRGRFAEKSES